MDELIDESNLTPEKLFNEKEFHTVIIGKEGLSKKDADKADWLTILISDEATREDKDEALKFLKEHQAADFMIEAIKQTEDEPGAKAKLIAACWETALDFSAYYVFFAELVAGNDYHCAIEAYTVLETLDTNIGKPVLEKALAILKNAKNKTPIVADAIVLVEEKLNAA